MPSFSDMVDRILMLCLIISVFFMLLLLLVILPEYADRGANPPANVLTQFYYDLMPNYDMSR